MKGEILKIIKKHLPEFWKVSRELCNFHQLSPLWNVSKVFILIICLLVCFFISNKRKNGWTNPAQIYVCSELQNIEFNNFWFS